MTKAELAKLIAKYERKLKKEYERGWNEAMLCKKGTKRLCSECKNKLMG